jgi:hypothetical protein
LAEPVVPVTPEAPVQPAPTDSTPPPPPPPSVPPAPPPPPASGYSRAALAWQPGAHDTCTQQDHLRYTAVGPDGKLYPTWHPPVDPLTGCSFGHEHGRDPAGSALAHLGPVIFGYANEQLEVHTAHGHRHEDHVGHKIEWGNSLAFPVHNRGDLPALTCDVLTKFHQGTHSPDAFTNNLHEIVKRLRCSDGSQVEATFLTANGPAGQFSAACRSEPIEAGAPTPPDSPRTANPLSPIRSIGNRFIPDRDCFERNRLHEVWKTQNVLLTADGQVLHRWAEYFNITNAARHFDPDRPNQIGYSIDACFEQTTPGVWRFPTGPCVTARNASDGVPYAYDDPRSPFNGSKRSNRLNDIQLYATRGNGVWYTDAFGQNGSEVSFPGSIRQIVVTAPGSANRTYVGPTIGGDYSAPGVRAPN